MQKFNFNNEVTVFLTESGISAYRHYIHVTYAGQQEQVGKWLSALDADGKLTIPLKELMRIYVRSGAHDMFVDDNLLIDEKDLGEHKTGFRI